MKAKVFIFVVLFTIVTCSTSCTLPETNIYKDYRCIDYNLSWLQSSSGFFSRYYCSEQDTRFIYIKIKGEPTDKYIGAWAMDASYLATGRHMVLAHKSTNLNIWKNWNINEIQLKKEFLNENNQIAGLERYAPEEIKKHTLASSKDTNMFNEIIALMTNDIKPFKVPEGYTDTNSTHDQHWYITIKFDESQSIIWEAKINIFQPPNVDDQKIVCVSIINKNNSISSEYIKIPNTSLLYKFVIDSF